MSIQLNQVSWFRLVPVGSGLELSGTWVKRFRLVPVCIYTPGTGTKPRNPFETRKDLGRMEGETL